MKGTEAMDHVRDEMAKAKDGYTAYMGELMTAWLRLHPDAELDGKKTLLRDAYERMVALFGEVERRIAELAEGMPEEAARYRAAVAKAARRMAERLES